MSVRRITLSQVGAETEDITKQQTLRLTLISLSMLSMCAVGRGFVKLVDISSVVPKKKITYAKSYNISFVAVAVSFFGRDLTAH